MCFRFSRSDAPHIRKNDVIEDLDLLENHGRGISMQLELNATFGDIVALRFSAHRLKDLAKWGD